MNRKTTRFHTLRESSAHKRLQAPVAMKRGLFYPHRRRLRPSRWVHVPQALRAALALTAAGLLLYSCDPPASPSSAAAEVTRISGLPNMAQVRERLSAQYAESPEGVTFLLDNRESSPDGKTIVRAVITYDKGKGEWMKIGSEKYPIKTITITREVDGKTIPTTVEYTDNRSKTRKTITSRYVHSANNARQSLEGGPRLAQAEAEGRTLHISGEEKDGDGNTLRTFRATEEIQEGGKIKLKTTYRRPDKEGFEEIVTTENGIPLQKVVTYSDKEAAAKGIKTKTITYEKYEVAMFFPDRQKTTLAVYTDAAGQETKRDELQKDDSMLTTMRDKSTITTTTKDNVTLAKYRDRPGGTVTKTIKTTRNTDGSTLAVHEDGEENETLRVETRSDGSTITTKTTAGVTTKELVIHPSVTAIEDAAFNGKDLTKLTIGNGVKTIGERAFYGNKLTKLTIGNGVQAIGKNAFQNNQLTELTIGNGVQTIGKNAFRNNELNKLTIGNGVQAIEDNAFQNNKLTELTIGNSVQTIGKNAFRDNKLNKLTIGDGVKTIGENAFQNNKLTELTIGNSVQTIGRQAFVSNDLTELRIPLSVNEIGEAAFANNKLTKVRLSKVLYEKRGNAFIGNSSPRFRGHKGEYY